MRSKALHTPSRCLKTLSSALLVAGGGLAHAVGAPPETISVSSTCTLAQAIQAVNTGNTVGGCSNSAFSVRTIELPNMAVLTSS